MGNISDFQKAWWARSVLESKNEVVTSYRMIRNSCISSWEHFFCRVCVCVCVCVCVRCKVYTIFECSAFIFFSIFYENVIPVVL